MDTRELSRVVLIGLAVVAITGTGARALAGDESAQQAGEQIGVEGEFVRLAGNSEGYVIVGYRSANESVNEEWMLLDVGMTVQHGVATQTITRDHVKLVTPDNQVIPLATEEEFEKAKGELVGLQERATTAGESIDYFPAGTNVSCRIGFFADPTHPREGRSFDQVELSSSNACVGRLYFHVPGGIKYGNYNLDVEFADSIVKVPMKIMTDQEAADFEKQWKEALRDSKHKDHDHE